MSVYDDRPRRTRSTRTREPQYVELEDEYIARGPNARELVLRPRDDEYDDYPAEVRRRSRYEDYGRSGRRARSHGVRDDDSYYAEDYYSDYSPRTRRTRSSRYDDDESTYDGERSERRDRRKSGVEKTLEDLGLGGVAAAVLGKDHRSKSGRRRGSSSDRSRRSRSRGGGDETRKKWQQAAKAAVITAAIEAVRSRKEPGGWTGQKGTRVATAAISAAGIDGLIDRDTDRHSKRHIVEAVVGGLGVNHVINGGQRDADARGRSMSRNGRARSQSIMDRIRSRSRSVFGRGRADSPGTMDAPRGRSQSRGAGAIVPLIAAGGVAAAGKAIWDRVRSKSRGRLGRSRSRSVGSEDSYVPSRRPRYAALRDRDGPPQYDGGQDQQQERGRGAVREDMAEQNPSGGDARARGARDKSSSSSNSDESKHSCSTTDLENQRKKTRLKELTTALFATAATVHAGHGVYSSIVASEKRHKAVMEGKITREQARKMKSKNIMQDAAAVGIAALGIKSAYAEWKEMNEQRREKHELEARKRRRKKQAEQRMQERKMQLEAFAAANGGLPGNFPPPGAGGGGFPGGGGGGQQQPSYGDANPYQAYGQFNNSPYSPPGGPPPAAAMGR